MFDQDRIYSKLNDEEKIAILWPRLPVGYDDQYKAFANYITTIVNYFNDLAEELMATSNPKSDEQIQVIITSIEHVISQMKTFASECPHSTCVLAYNVACEHSSCILESAVLAFRSVNNIIFTELIDNYQDLDYLNTIQLKLNTIYARFFAVMAIVYPGCIAL